MSKSGVRGLAGGLHEIGTGDRAELGADEDGGPLLRAGIPVALGVAPFRAHEVARPGRERGERDPVFLVGLLDAGGLEVLQDHAGEVLLSAVAEPGFRHAVDELVVLVDAQHAVGRNALHREGACDADLPVVLVGFVVEVFVIRLGCDGGVDLLLPGDALCPPVAVNISGLLGPSLFGVAGDFPLFPGGAERAVQLFTQRLQRLLELLPDHVDLGVVGDGLERDVGHALVHETLSDVVVGRRFRRRLARDLAFLLPPLRAVGEEVIRVARGHDPGVRERQRDARGVDGDPAPAPLLGHVGRRAGTAGGVQNEIAGVGGHEDAAFDDLGARLNNVDFIIGKGACPSISPHIGQWDYRKIVKESHVLQCPSQCWPKTFSLFKPNHADGICLPSAFLGSCN